MERVMILGGPPLYREAVGAQLHAQGVVAVVASVEDCSGSALDSVDVVLAYCETEDDWKHLEALAGRRLVAVLPDFEPGGLIRALAGGAAPVHLRTSSEIIVATARTAATGEALLPMGLAQSLATRVLAAEMPEELDPTELKLVSGLASNAGVAQMARDLGYSDRTVRRRLQTLYVKLGVATRGEAVHRCQQIKISETVDDRRL